MSALNRFFTLAFATICIVAYFGGTYGSVFSSPTVIPDHEAREICGAVCWLEDIQTCYWGKLKKKCTQHTPTETTCPAGYKKIREEIQRVSTAPDGADSYTENWFKVACFHTWKCKRVYEFGDWLCRYDEYKTQYSPKYEQFLDPILCQPPGS